MNQPSDNTSPQPGARRSARRPLLIGGLVVIFAAVLVCVAALGAGGLVWLRSTQTPAPDAVMPSPDALSAVAPAADAPGAPTPEHAADTLASAADDAVNRIVFVDAAGQVGTVAPDGSARRLLTQAGAIYQFPAWSPDSNQIAAVGSDGAEGGVYVWADQENSARTDLYRSSRRPPIYLYWSPDGRQVSFLANSRSGLGLWLAETDGAGPPREIASGQPFYWNWSQSGDQLFLHSGGFGPDAQLAFLTPGAGEAGDNVASPGLFQTPGISPDGRYLAYGQRQGQRFQVVIEERATGQRTTAPHTGIAALGWSPTAPTLAWISPRGDQMSSAGPLRLLDAQTGEMTTLAQDTVFAFFWSPDGKTIAYLTLSGGADDAGAGRPAGLAALAHSQPAQHPPLSLRLWAVDVASGQQRALRTFTPPDVFINQFLPFFDQYAHSHRLWSPASDAVVLPMIDASGVSGIYVVSAEDGEATRVASGTMAFWSLR